MSILSVVVLDCTGSIVLRGEEGARISSIVYSVDGAQLIAGDVRGNITFFDIESGQTLRTVSGHSRETTTLAMSPDGTVVASGSRDGDVKLWDTDSYLEKRTLIGHSTGVRSVAFGAQPDVLVSSSYDGLVRVWDLSALADDDYLHCSGPVFCVQLSKDASTVAVVESGLMPPPPNQATGMIERRLRGEAFLWSLRNREVLCHIAEGKSYRRASPVDRRRLRPPVKFSQDMTVLATASDQGDVEIWDVATNRIRTTLCHQSAFPNRFARVTPGGSPPISKGRNLRAKAEVLDLAFSPDNQTLAVSHKDGLRLWDVFTGASLVRDSLGNRFSAYLAFSPDGKTLALGNNQEIRLFDVAAFQEEVSLPVDLSTRCLAFSPDGQALLYGGYTGREGRGEARLWNLRARKQRTVFRGHSKEILCAAFSPDGRTLATGGADDTVRMWDIQSGREYMVVDMAEDAAKTMAFSADGKTLAIGTSGGVVRFWRAATDEEVERTYRKAVPD